MPQLLQGPAVIPGSPAVARGRYHWVHSPFRRNGHDFVAGIGLIRQQTLRLEALNQWQRLGAIRRRASGHHYPYRHFVDVHHQVQFVVSPLWCGPWLGLRRNDGREALYPSIQECLATSGSDQKQELILDDSLTIQQCRGFVAPGGIGLDMLVGLDRAQRVRHLAYEHR